MKTPLCGLLALCALSFGQQVPPATPPPQQTPDQTQSQPPPPPPPATYDPSENAFSIGVFGFLPHAHPDLLAGKQATDAVGETYRDLGKTRDALGVTIIAPAGKGNTLEFTGFQLNGRGGQTVPIATTVFGTTFAAADLISTSYRIRNLKLSYNYLTYPAPPGGSKWRFRTLYEIQFNTFKSSFNSNTEASPVSSQGSYNAFYPTFGVGLGYIASKNFHIESKASGFAFPHRSTIWDAEIKAVIRVGRVDADLGFKGYHFRTTPQQEEYYRVTLLGPYVGLRYTFR